MPSPNRLTLLLLGLFVLTTTLIAQSPDNDLPTLAEVLPGLTPDNQKVFESTNEILVFHGESVSPEILPRTSLSDEIEIEMVSGGLTIGIEGLFFIQDLPEAYWTANAEDRETVLYNILRSVSTLQGLEYYSASRGETRLLFEESWAIDDPGTRNRIPDPLVENPPTQDIISVHQKDKSFGSNRYTMEFRTDTQSIATGLINLTPMRYSGLIRVVNPGNMQTHLIVVPVQEGLLIYGTMAADTLNVRAFRDRARNSFTNRVIAMRNWFEERLWEEF